ncbi:APC family permease [Chondrinema litorale]|uniref:APC family permease n=1 Tax=Chondrinema litorale TaxID=2994555 RepID=UPI002543D6B7|nr:amino acid permease [Chondrinema litorale]UZR92635.1 amino acid permease [Chondrinema litorale]
MKSKKISLYTATSIVVANMIGTGVFTSLGYQVIDIKSVFPLLILWVVGGITALCGALTYGELAASLPRSGGEYNFLREIYHPSIGFVSGWVSATVGFAAPTALAAMALGKYAESVLPQLNATYLAAIVVIGLTILHASNKNFGSKFQNLFTTVKVILIFLFIGAGFFIEIPQSITILPQPGDFEILLSPAFAISLIYVSYAYTGWNAAAYITSEMENPKKNVPLALFQGTLLVMVLYVLLNFIFLYTASMSSLEGQIEIGYISAIQVFGETGGKLMGITISLLLISTVSAMVFAGPRVMQVMGEDISFFSFLSKTKNDIPRNAIIFQSVLTLLFIFSSSFDQALTFAGFTLSLNTFLTVAGVFVLRIKKPALARPFKVPGYPITPLIFLILVGWTLIFILRDKLTESLVGLATVFAGFIIYFLIIRNKKSD